MAYAWGERKANRWAARIVLICGIVSVIAISIMKVEATVADPATYLEHHPLKDRLLAPTWIAVELGAFAACSLAGAGLVTSAHVVGAAIGLLVEVGVAALTAAVWLGELVVRSVLVIGRLVVGLLLIPAELSDLAIRRRVGTDLDGTFYLPLPSGWCPDGAHRDVGYCCENRKEESKLKNPDSQKISVLGIGRQGSGFVPEAFANAVHGLFDKERATPTTSSNCATVTAPRT